MKRFLFLTQIKGRFGEAFKRQLKGAITDERIFLEQTNYICKDAQDDINFSCYFYQTLK